MVNKEVEHMNMYDRDAEPAFSKADKKDKLSRDVLAYLIAKEIKSHRQLSVAGKRIWTRHEIEMMEWFFLDYLISVREEEGGKIVTKHHFFTRQEWHRIMHIASEFQNPRIVLLRKH